MVAIAAINTTASVSASQPPAVCSTGSATALRFPATHCLSSAGLPTSCAVVRSPCSWPSAPLHVGGGGLCAGIALALKEVRPEIRVVGVRAPRTLPGVAGFTIADGIQVKRPGELTMSILEQVCDELVSVTDEEISEAIVLLLECASSSSKAPAQSAWPRCSPDARA